MSFKTLPCRAASINTTLPVRNSISTPRFFTTTFPRPQTSKPPKKATKLPSAAAAPSKSQAIASGAAAAASATRANLAAKVAALPEPVTLYKNTRYKSYIFGAYGIGALCAGWGFVASGTVQKVEQMRVDEGHPEENNRWSSTVFYGVGVFACVGTLFMYTRAQRLVMKITTIPNAKSLMYRVYVRRNIPLPFIRPRSFVVAVDDLLFPNQVTATSARDAFLPGATQKAGVWQWFVLLTRAFQQGDIAQVKIRGAGNFRVDTLGEFGEIHGVSLFSYGRP